MASNNFLKKLVIFYSLDGNTKFISETIAQTIGADLLELKPVKDINNQGAAKYFWGGRQVIFKTKPELQALNLNPADYDLIFIGTPVWAFTFAPALKTFFSQTKLTNKKIVVFCSHEGHPGKTLENMADELHANEIISQQDFLGPYGENNQANEQKAIDWVNNTFQLCNI